ncbi:hypothetical protein BDR03DRAFT_1016881 [Suillus americanus]|nr:hypothetical protein BDR03DRAFT_1016881 [Suillus americanus]
MAVIKNYVCTAQAGCNKAFTKYHDLKRHEAAHSHHSFACRFAGCDFVTLSKPSFEIHTDRHTGKQRYVCPKGCGFKTHNPAALTRHRKAEHGHVPQPRHPYRSASRTNSLTSFQPPPQPQIQPQPQLQPQPQPQPQLQPQPPAFNQHYHNNNNMLGVLHARPNMQAYAAPARPAPANGWQLPAAPAYYPYNPYAPAGAPNPYNMYAAPAAGANVMGYPGYPYRQY